MMSPLHSPGFRRALALTILTVALAVGRPARAEGTAAPMRRIAVLVGANEAPAGRRSLRFAHDDARQLADVLERVGRFAATDVHVLFDPEPAELEATLTAAADDVRRAAGDALFVFYYSGHSDGQSLFPHGDAVSVGKVRDRIEQIGARIRVGILDTCSGGSWTQAKGLTVGPPLDPTSLFNLSTEGTALVSSSSGIEDAHEAAEVNGSFFTHHFAAGLLGAADRTGDGNITLGEAFDYAKELTVRDSARLASMPQHPSFDLELRGRQDIVLTVVSSSPSALEVTGTRAPVEVIHLATGITIAEVSPSPQPVRIAVPPGRYLVRSVVDGRVLSHELEIHPGETVSIAGGQLEATGDGRIAIKGDESPPETLGGDRSTPRKRHGVLQVLAGASEGPLAAATNTGTSPSYGTAVDREFAFDFHLTVGITDRLAWTFPFVFMYRFGTHERFEVIPYAGATHGWYEPRFGVWANFTGGTSLRLWTGKRQSLILTVEGDYEGELQTSETQAIHPGEGKSAALAAIVGYELPLEEALIFHLDAGVQGWVAVGHWRPGDGGIPDPLVVLGGTQMLGGRTLPLLEAHLSRKLSLDATAAVGLNLRTGAIIDWYLGGFTLAY